MKGQACSWADMRKVRLILAQKERLQGQYAALTRCVNKGTVSKWRRAIELMEKVALTQLEHVTPTHATEIAQAAHPDAWKDWVKRCEKEQWTVAQPSQLPDLEPVAVAE